MSAPPTDRRSLRPALAVALGAVSVLLAAEVSLRSPAIRSLVPREVVFYSDNVVNRLRALERVQREEGAIDLLLVGSSVVRANLRPLVMDAVLAETGRPERVFNAGFSGLVPDQVRLYLEHLWLERARPRAVIQGIRMVELADPRRADALKDFERARLERLWLRDDLAARLEAAAIRHLALVRYRGVLTDLWSRPRWPPGRPMGFVIDRRGWGPSDDRLAVARRAGKGPVPYDGSWPAEQVEAGLAVLAASAALCRARSVAFAVVDMPEHEDRWSGEDGGALRERYREALGRFGREQGVRVWIDPDRRGAWAEDRFFADGHHMSPAGAERFSTWLAGALADAGWPPPQTSGRQP